MGFFDKLRQTGDSVRRLWRSRGPDCFSRYIGLREYERKRADRERGQAEDAAEQERASAERERGHEERYARERGESADDPEPDR